MEQIRRLPFTRPTKASRKSVSLRNYNENQLLVRKESVFYLYINDSNELDNINILGHNPMGED